MMSIGFRFWANVGRMLRARTNRGRAPSRRPRLDVELLEPRCLLDASVFRSIDGTGNNLTNPEWGSTLEQLLRVAPADYGDGISTPAGADRPSAREISNVLAAHVA